jgi:AcrR family transcriptional regulator
MSVGLREQKKLETRTVIANAAMQLFSSRGFDAVTVAEVAEEARVSEKTVFNYFPAKEDLFFDEADEREQALVADLRDRAPGESMLAALRRSAAANCGRLCSEHFAHFARIIDNSAALQRRERQMFARFARVLEAALLDEGQVTQAEAAVAANAVIGAYAWMFHTARKRALAGEYGPAATKRLRSELEKGFSVLESLGSFAPGRAN